MEDFDFDYHSVSINYPESGSRLQLGGSYTFTAAPTSPDQRVLVLSFPAMRSYWNKNTNQPDLTTEPKINVWRLEQFYLRHRLYKRFTYSHPQHGSMVVTFNKPFSTPKKEPGIAGFFQSFELELLEHP